MSSSNRQPTIELQSDSNLTRTANAAAAAAAAGDHQQHHHPPIALEELFYSRDAFYAVALPTSVATILCSLCVVFINDGSNGQSAGGIGIPVVFEQSSSDSAQQTFTNALVNALAIVGVITVVTFFMVFLYYLKYMRVLFGWLILSTSLLLAFSTGLVIQTALSLWNVPADALTYSFVFYNFAIGGVVAIFYGKGIPLVITQGYLIAISITMAWILIRFLPDWTTWMLLGVLALYDICAVLTPCGPLKWLMDIMTERDDPLPGLLYQANVGQPRPQSIVRNVGANGPAPVIPPRPENYRRPADIEAMHLSRVSPSHNVNNNTDPTLPLVDNTSSQTTSLHPRRTASPSVNQPTMAITTTDQYYEQNTPPRTNEEDYEEESDDDGTIKLGLGDFVFYSILCGKSALVSFTTFIVVFLVVQVGLALTMLLLASFKKALPALPLSIFLGLLFFFLTELVMVPFVGFNAVRLEVI